MREATLAVDEAAFEAMGIEELFDLGREAGLTDLEELACHGTGAVVLVTTTGRFDEPALSSLQYVDRWEYLGERTAGHRYLIAFHSPSLPDHLDGATDDLLGTCDPDLDDTGATMSFVGPHDAVVEAIRSYEAAGLSPDLRSLGGYDGHNTPIDALTDRQREVLEAAHEAGYYDVPRSASTAAVAAALDLDPSTVAEHLQRAEHNLIASLLGPRE